MNNTYIHPHYLTKYNFKIGDFRGYIYLPQDTKLEIVADEIIESLSVDLEDRQRLLEENNSILVSNGRKIINVAI